MKSFKKFYSGIKNVIEPILITAIPMHGKHSELQETVPIVTAEPMHGKHSLKEDTDGYDKKYYDWASKNDNEHLGKGTLDVHDKINKSKGDFYAHHGTDLGEHLYNYSVFSGDANKVLIHDAKNEKVPFDKGFGDPAAREKHARNLIDGVDSALSKSKIDHDLHVYHGTNAWHPGEESSKHPEGHVRVPSFLSTSISKSSAINFTRPRSKLKNKGLHILHIHLKPGQHGVYLGDNSDHTDEHEFLMPRNTKLKIHPNPDILKYDNKDLHIWHAHPVGDDK